MTDLAPAPSRSSWLSTLGWAAYLACSWTWCIGMFLPVLLVRDYGIWGFVAFAVPNVVGAGAMGTVLRTPDAARRIRERHREACRWFSIVTIAFQYFFFLALLGGSAGLYFLAPLLLAAVFGSGRIVAAVTWMTSITLLALANHAGVLSVQTSNGEFAMTQAAWLAPVCVFGFVLCPYLDLTFLRVRAETDNRSSTAAFAVGFGVLFLAMIFGTLAYSRLGLEALNKYSIAVLPSAALLIVAHVSTQVGFTIDAHGWQLAQTSRTSSDVTRKTAALYLFGAVIGGAAMHGVGFVINDMLGLKAMTSFEIGYRLFMSFYGLLFPAYVWLCMIPARGEGQTQKPTRKKLIVLGTACLLAAPCYWMGFIERETVWLVPGLAVVLVARVFIRARKDSGASSPAPGGRGPVHAQHEPGEGSTPRSSVA